MKTHFFLILGFILILGFVSADVISINSGGGAGLVINPNFLIEGFFSQANNLPIMSNVVLFSTYGTNLTTENLTVTFTSTDEDNDAITNISDWRVDSNSIAVLNMPFDTSGSLDTAGAVRDYSTYGNNGTLGGGVAVNAPTWTSSCQIGGCYDFDGNDYIRIENDVSLSTGNSLTISSWVYWEGGSGDNNIITKESAYEIRINSGNVNYATNPWAWRGGTGANVAQNKWTYVTFTHNGSGLQHIYIDGENKYSIASGGNISSNTNPVTIGARYAGTGSFFNGSIDNVQIFNRALSPQQISEMYNAGLAGHNVENLMSQETNKGEDWQVAMTPNDAFGDGITVLSNILTIANTKPVVSNVVLESSLLTNTTFENLSVTYDSIDIDGDVITNISDWRINSTSLMTLNMPFDTNENSLASNAIRDYSTYENNGTLGGGASANSPTWTPSCQIGGCYDFDGINDFVQTDFSTDGRTEVTFSFWAKVDTWKNYGYIMDTSSAGGCGIRTTFSGSMDFFCYAGGNHDLIAVNTGNSYSWNYYTFIQNTTGSTLYFNGNYINKNVQDDSAGIGVGTNMKIGAEYTGGNSFDGVIDNVQIFDRSLSYEQIQEIYQAGLANHNVENFMSQETAVGDFWQVAMTPNDAVDDGITVLSNELEIVDITAPNITIISPLPINYSTLDIDFNLTINEDVSLCYYDLDNVGNITMTSLNLTYYYTNNASIGPGPHDVTFWCSDPYGNWGMNATNFTVDNAAAIAVLFSDNLTDYIKWNVVSLPIDDLDAIGNNFNSSTGYYINISAVNTLVDLYVKADGNLFTAGLDEIGLGNETYAVSTNDSTVTGAPKVTMTTDYAMIGSSMGDSSVIFMKFYLDGDAGQAAGVYLNQLNFKAVREGESP